MADRNADNADLVVDELKRKARRRLVGAIVLALAAAVIVPMLLEKDPRPLGDDVSVQIPPVDEGKFINRLTGKSGDTKPLPKADDKADPKAGSAKVEAKPDVKPDAAPAAPAHLAVTPVDSPPPGKSLAEAEQRVLAPKPAPKAEAKPAPAAKAAAPDAKAAAKTAPPEAKPKPVAEAKSEPRPATETKAEPAAPVAETKPEPKPEPRPASVEARPASGASSTMPAAPAKADGFVVQLAAFADDKGANALANKLKKVGYAAYVEPVETSRGTLWRVRVGGYGSRPDADAARVKLKGEGYSGIVAPAK